MALFYPKIHFKSVCEITPQLLKAHNITGLIIDIDNTLTAQDGSFIPPEIENWLEEIKQHAACVLVSNNHKKRVEDFAKQVGLPCVHFALKPIPFAGLAKGAKILGKKPRELAVVGDQLFTDVAGANLLGALSIRVEPLLISEKKKNGFKRKLEQKITDRYLSKEGGSK